MSGSLCAPTHCSDHLGVLPSAAALQESGVQVHGKGTGGPSKGREKTGVTVSGQIIEALSRLGGVEETATETATPRAVKTSVILGPCLAALPKKTVEKILADEYVYFSEFPPAKGKSRALPQLQDGQIVVVQLADLMQARNLIPDLATWTQCFSLFVAAMAPHKPRWVPELMAYQTIITKASMRYKWPSWVIYDQSFRQDLEGNPEQSWGKVDPSAYALCFTGQAKSDQNWCANCKTIDHASSSCPNRMCTNAPNAKRLWSAAFTPPQGSKEQAEVCRKFNKFNGDCKFGKGCRFKHVCSSCGDPHPATKCKGPGLPKSDSSRL